MSGKVWLQAPPEHFWKFPPAPEPQSLPAPQGPISFAQPFNINPTLYNAALDFKVPVTIAGVYAATVFILNRINRQRGHKPWAISKTRAFFAFVIFHNVFLAIYSAWTHIGMINAIWNILPGWHGMSSLPEVVDSLCKMQGPRGIGNSVGYDYEGSQWFVGNPAIKLLNNQPDSTDVGRLWNEGLAFYGWLFYLSKFYEVIDTLVILAKGKRSSFLQTYHHAGAMMCMWAGIRYMSPPIWMFCWINSGIHALMYTYYTVSALGIRVPGALKRTLTTMQITQFLIGFTFAIMHLFVAYKIPVQSPYVYYHNLTTALPSATSAVASAVATADIGSWLKKAILRAAGDEGLSANVRNRNGNLFGHSGEQAVLAESDVLNHAKEEIRYKTEYVSTNCIDTSGQAFAVYLNLLYLLPLTMLFVRFFVKSYLRRPTNKNETQSRRFSKSAYDAVKGTEKEMVKAARRDRGSAFTSPAHSDAEATTPTAGSFKHKNKLSMTKINEKAEDLISQGVNGVKNLSEKAKKSDVPANAKDLANKATESVKEAASNLQQKTEKSANDITAELKQASEEKIGDVKKEAEDAGEAAKSPSKKKKKNKNKANQNNNQSSEPPATSEPNSYADAAAKPPTSGDNDVVAAGDAADALEANIDELKNEEEKEAEAEMQPDGLAKS